MKGKIQSAKFTGIKSTTKKYWLGCYGGHYDIVVLFRKKPTHTCISDKDVVYIDCLEESNAGNIAGDMALDDFITYFPGLDISTLLKNGRPKDTEIPVNGLLQVELTAPIDKYGRLISVNFHADWR